MVLNSSYQELRTGGSRTLATSCSLKRVLNNLQPHVGMVPKEKGQLFAKPKRPSEVLTAAPNMSTVLYEREITPAGKKKFNYPSTVPFVLKERK